jgi:hypothetical protein
MVKYVGNRFCVDSPLKTEWAFELLLAEGKTVHVSRVNDIFRSGFEWSFFVDDEELGPEGLPWIYRAMFPGSEAAISLAEFEKMLEELGRVLPSTPRRYPSPPYAFSPSSLLLMVLLRQVRFTLPRFHFPFVATVVPGSPDGSILPSVLFAGTSKQSIANLSSDDDEPKTKKRALDEDEL